MRETKQEASTQLPTDISTRATLAEYSDLFDISGSSFLLPEETNTSIDSTTTTTTTTTAAASKSAIDFSSENRPTSYPHLTPDTSSLIDLISNTPIHTKRIHTHQANHEHDQTSNPNRHNQPSSPPIRSAKKYSYLMDHSISSFDLLPKALSPSTPSSRKNNRLLFNQPVSPHSHCTPPSSPSKLPNKILSPYLHLDPFSPSLIPSGRPKSAQSLGTNITRTHSVDLLPLDHHHTPRPSISRSKSTTAIHHERDHHDTQSSCPSDPCEPPKATKSILKRPNSPSKGARARFFSPRVLSRPTGDEESDGNESSWVDEHGNCRGREIIHEFQKDEPPMTRPNPIFKPLSTSQSLTPRKNVLPSSTSSGSSCSARRHHHTPKFIIPEPIDLGIEPILPRHSTSPSPSPPSLPPASYLMNARAHHRKSAPSAHTFQPHHDQSMRSNSTSLTFNAPDNLSNILDESGGFLCTGNETTWTGENKERSTELSIDLNHVAMMELLGKKKLGNNLNASRAASNLSKLNSRSSECEIVPEEEEEEEESVDVSGLARQLEDIKSCLADKIALKDEQAPANLRGSMDFSTTFESSKIILPPLPTDRDQLWKNSKPKEVLPSLARPKRHSMLNLDYRTEKRGVIHDDDTARLKQKIDSIKLSTREEARSVAKNDLFAELMSAPPPSLTSQRTKVSQPSRPNTGTSKISTVPPSTTRPSATTRRLSDQMIAFPGKPNSNKITHTNPVSKPRMSCVSTSAAPPVRAKRVSNIGIGLPTSSSAPTIHTLTKLTSKTAASTAGLTGVRSKLKPSTALVKPSHHTSGSPRTMKSRSSLSNIALNSPRLQYHASSPRKPSQMAAHAVASPAKARRTLPVPGSTTGTTLPAPRPPHLSSASSDARSELLAAPPRSALPAPGSLGTTRPRTAPCFSDATPARPPSSCPTRILPPSSPSKTTARHIQQKI
ncbi:hypothetical protein PCANC_09626 [Puccinia coronata f. sp. avenae]|uniref:Uncharacterized protein n=1 Tax=Puccinia coronata f. sp. avenae TaxID=200324 RepID=A0A2N5V1U9_9BASI|nr:hypothetical protein PCANC_09626 [Puccinia coronata f. sp. avenae]